MEIINVAGKQIVYNTAPKNKINNNKQKLKYLLEDQEEQEEEKNQPKLFGVIEHDMGHEMAAGWEAGPSVRLAS